MSILRSLEPAFPIVGHQFQHHVSQRYQFYLLRRYNLPITSRFIPSGRLFSTRFFSSQPVGDTSRTKKFKGNVHNKRPEIPKPFKIDIAKQPVIDAQPINQQKNSKSTIMSDSRPEVSYENPSFTSISPPFWQTTKFKKRLFIILVGILSGYAIGRYRGRIEHHSEQHTSSSEQKVVGQLQLNEPKTDKSANSNLAPITDEIFDTTDNLCVIWVDSIEQLEKRKQDVNRFINYIESLELPVNLKYMYSIRSTPLVTTTSDPKVAEYERDALTVVIYKGQRKLHFFGRSKPTPQTEELFHIQTENIREFFKPISEEDFCINQNDLENEPVGADEESRGPVGTDEDSRGPVGGVTFKTFQDKVVDASSPTHPIVLQLMEDSCFLCFLIRPFINSINRTLKEHNIPVTIKRFNLDRNDFPPECPVVRSTPTFVAYRGQSSVKDGAPPPWKEYKPREFIVKLTEEFNLSSDVRQQLEALEEKMQERFQKFGLLSIWTQELAHLQSFHSGESLPPLQRPETGESALDDQYNKIVSELMQKDTRRIDCLEENLEYLDKEIAAVEADCVAYAHIIGERILKVDSRFDLIKARLLFDAEQGEKNERDIVGSRKTTETETANVTIPQQHENSTIKLKDDHTRDQVNSNTDGSSSHQATENMLSNDSKVYETSAVSTLRSIEDITLTHNSDHAENL